MVDNVVEILNDIVTELTQSPEHWSQGAMAYDKDGHKCSAFDPQAVSWCLEGHFLKRTGTLCSNVSRTVHEHMAKHEKDEANKLKVAMLKPGFVPENYVSDQYGTVYVSNYNDAKGRTVSDIIELCKNAVGSVK